MKHDKNPLHWLPSVDEAIRKSAVEQIMWVSPSLTPSCKDPEKAVRISTDQLTKACRQGAYAAGSIRAALEQGALSISNRADINAWAERMIAIAEAVQAELVKVDEARCEAFDAKHAVQA